jgi:MoaA/NifB/PqqE/SkfB family radical SAM enzyme
MAESERTPARAVGRRALTVRAAEPRSDHWSACYAPHTAMYFDQFGKVRACCQNTGVYLGDVATQSLREIWESAGAEQVRDALEHDDFSAGCEFCAWQIREHNEDILFARQYDLLAPDVRRPAWPKLMEFSVTNTCNLACAMCNGDWSSTIRAKRERRPPIPAAYHDRFYEELAEFLPHLEQAKFLGGEPFLGQEPLRIMEMLAELPEPPEVTITTNGTIYTNRVRRILDALAPNVVLSIDGASTATYDAIRVGAHFPDVISNLDRFRAELGPGRVSITHCLMTSNWHEFADLLRIAEERDLKVGVNVVRLPQEQSLYQLDADDLAHVVASLHATDVSMLTGLRLATWNGHLAALEHRLEVIRSDDRTLGIAHGLPGVPKGPPGIFGRSPWPGVPFPEHRVDPPPLTPAAPAPDATALEIGFDGRVQVVQVAGPLPFGIRDTDGAHADVLGEQLHEWFGHLDTWTITAPADHEDQVRIRTGDDGSGSVLDIQIDAKRDDDGQLLGARYLLTLGASSDRHDR